MKGSIDNKMSGIIKRIFLVSVKSRFGKDAFGPYTSRVKAEELQQKLNAGPDVLSTNIEEIAVNPDVAFNISDWFKKNFS